MTRIAELYVNGALIGRELAPNEVHTITADASRITHGDLTRDVPLSQLAQVFVDGAEAWRNPDAEIAKAVEQGRIHTVVANDGVTLVDQAG